MFKTKSEPVTKATKIFTGMVLLFTFGAGSVLAGDSMSEGVIVIPQKGEILEARAVEVNLDMPIEAKLLEMPDKAADVKVSLEEAILIAKKHFTISDSFDVFRSGYSEYNGSKTWQLSWYDQSGNLGEMSAAINAETGEVMSYHYYDPREHEQAAAQGYLPKLTREEAEKIALNYFEKLTNKKAGQISQLPRFYEEPMLRKGIKYYDFNYAGLINGFVYPLNKVVITINADTGELRNFYHTWDSQSVFPGKISITQEEAEKLVKEELDMELAYYKGYDRNVEKPVQLVYQAKNANQILIDAATGKPLVQTEYYYYGEGFYDRQMATSQEKMGYGGITPVEQQELEKMSGLLSKDKALAIAAQKVPIPKGYTLQNSGLNRDWEFPQLVIWSFSWRIEDKEKSGWLNVELDAKTGQLIGYSFNEYDPRGKDDYVKSDDYAVKNRTQALELARKYIADNYPEIKDNLKLVEPTYKNPLLEEHSQSHYYFQFIRLVDGIPFNKNFMNISIDAAKGQINSMHLRWVELVFPKADRVIDLEQMKESFLAENQVKLEYVKHYDREKLQEEVYLVYKIPYVQTTLYDAQTGAKLNYNGDLMEEKTAPEYTDVKGHWAEEDILLLSQYRLLPFTGTEFMPEQAITQGELVQVLVKLDNPWYDLPGIDPVYQQVTRRGLLKQEEIAPDSSVQRDELALLLVRFLGFEDVSKLDIFKLEFKDADQIALDNRGAVAIINGFGFMQGDSEGNFMPDKKTTRAEVVSVIARMLRR